MLRSIIKRNGIGYSDGFLDIPPDFAFVDSYVFSAAFCFHVFLIRTHISCLFLLSQRFRFNLIILHLETSLYHNRCNNRSYIRILKNCNKRNQLDISLSIHHNWLEEASIPIRIISRNWGLICHIVSKVAIAERLLHFKN